MDNKLYIGWGVENITPQGKVLLGGQFFERVPEYTHDPLQATAMAVRSGTNGKLLLWVSVDLTMIKKPIVQEITDKISCVIQGFERSQLIISATHTHTAPELSSDGFSWMWGDIFKIDSNRHDCLTPEEYVQNTLIPQIVKACLKAYNNMTVSGVSTVLTSAVVGHCRRLVYKDGSSVMYGKSDREDFFKQECAEDNYIETLCIFDANQELTGVMMNITCPAQVVELSSYYSADFVGSLRKKVLQKTGKKVPLLIIIGAAGNISPRDLVRRGRGEGDLCSHEYCDEIGVRLYTAFEYAVEKAKADIQYDAKFEHKFFEWDLPLRTVSESEYQAAKQQFEKIVKKYPNIDEIDYDDKVNAHIPAGVIKRFELQSLTKTYSAPVHIVRLGDASLVTNPFELFIEYGNIMRARIKSEFVFIAQLSDDYGTYLPTEEIVRSGSYSVLVSNCLVDGVGGEILTEKTIIAANKQLEV